MSEKTFRELESASEIHTLSLDSQSALDLWYERVRDTPVGRLTTGDICRSCRQRLFPEAIVPVAVARLSMAPAAGDKYEGELLVALRNISPFYWKAHRDQAAQVMQAAQRARRSANPELQADIDHLCQTLARK